MLSGPNLTIPAIWNSYNRRINDDVVGLQTRYFEKTRYPIMGRRHNVTCDLLSFLSFSFCLFFSGINKKKNKIK
jgi:hypothetical protein